MMDCRKTMGRFGLVLASLAAGLLGVAAVDGQDASSGPRADRESLPKPVFKVANKLDGEQAATDGQAPARPTSGHPRRTRWSRRSILPTKRWPRSKTTSKTIRASW